MKKVLMVLIVLLAGFNAMADTKVNANKTVAETTIVDGKLVSIVYFPSGKASDVIDHDEFIALIGSYYNKGYRVVGFSKAVYGSSYGVTEYILEKK